MLTEAVDYFFGEKACVPASTNLHDRLMDLLLTALSFSLDDPGVTLQYRREAACARPLNASCCPAGSASIVADRWLLQTYRKLTTTQKLDSACHDI